MQMVSFLIALTTPSNAKSLFNIVTSHLYTFAPMDIVVLTEGLDVTIPSRPGSWTLWRRLEAVAENADNKYDVEFSAECQRLLDDVNGLRKLMFRDVVSTVAAWCAVDEEDLEQFLRRTSSIESALGTDQINLIVPYLQKVGLLAVDVVTLVLTSGFHSSQRMESNSATMLCHLPGNRPWIS